MFPHWEKAGTFTVDVYTTSKLIAFRVQRSDGHPQEQELLTEFVSYPLNSIIATYRVGIPWMKDSVSGVYTISVTNGDDESAAQTVEIERAQGECYILYCTYFDLPHFQSPHQLLRVYQKAGDHVHHVTEKLVNSLKKRLVFHCGHHCLHC